MCPNTKSDTVDVIDPETYKIIDHFALPKKGGKLMEPQHIIPSWDLKKLWVAQDLGDQLTAIDPATGKKGETVTVDDPYNMYYTPDGKYALVMAEREKRIDFRDPTHYESGGAPACRLQRRQSRRFHPRWTHHDCHLRIFE